MRPVVVAPPRCQRRVCIWHATNEASAFLERLRERGHEGQLLIDGHVLDDVETEHDAVAASPSSQIADRVEHLDHIESALGRRGDLSLVTVDALDTLVSHVAHGQQGESHPTADIEDEPVSGRREVRSEQTLKVTAHGGRVPVRIVVPFAVIARVVDGHRYLTRLDGDVCGPARSTRPR